MIDCLEDGQVTLVKDGRMIAEQRSDNYGDFKFDRLAENSGEYRVEIAAAGYESQTVAATLGSSVNLGEIRLKASVAPR